MTNWNEIIREHGPTAYRTAWRILGHAQDCEDVLQEVYLEAHKLFVRDEVTHWRTFLHRLVTFRALDALRRRRDVGSLDESEIFGVARSPDDVAIEREEEARLRSIVAALPPRQAAVFCLAHFDELSHEEIGKTLDVSVGAVAAALHKARGRLRTVMRETSLNERQ